MRREQVLALSFERAVITALGLARPLAVLDWSSPKPVAFQSLKVVAMLETFDASRVTPAGRVRRHSLSWTSVYESLSWLTAISPRFASGMSHRVLSRKSSGRLLIRSAL